ncbi:MAG: Mov34/MPN/PAD-1 family protein [archaeon]
MNSKIEDIKNLVITKGVLEKMRAISRIVCEKGNYEWYGFLLNPWEKNDLVAYNVILAYNQRVSATSVEVDPVGVMNSKAEIKNMKCSAIGCCHSHHNMGAFHSGTDDHNLDKLVYGIARNREIVDYRAQADGIYPEGNSLRIVDKGKVAVINSSKPISCNLEPINIEKQKSLEGLSLTCFNSYRLLLKPEKGLTMSWEDNQKEINTSTSFAYSVVVSGLKTYAELAAIKSCNNCGDHLLAKVKVDVEVITPENDVKFSEKDLRKEISEKVSFSGGFWKK